MTGRELFEYLKEKGMADEVLRVGTFDKDDWEDIEEDNIWDFCDVILIDVHNKYR